MWMWIRLLHCMQHGVIDGLMLKIQQCLLNSAEVRSLKIVFHMNRSKQIRTR